MVLILNDQESSKTENDGIHEINKSIIEAIANTKNVTTLQSFPSNIKNIQNT